MSTCAYQEGVSLEAMTRPARLAPSPLEAIDGAAQCLSRSLLPLAQDRTLIVVIELSQSSWLVAGLVPGVERRPLKKLRPDEQTQKRGDSDTLPSPSKPPGMASGWRDGSSRVQWKRILSIRRVSQSREHKRAKTDRLDTAMLGRVFLGWLRGERGHCSMVAVPTIEQEDAKRPSRERESLTGERTRIINRMKSALARLGIRGFKPELRKAPQFVDALRTPEDALIPPNTL